MRLFLDESHLIVFLCLRTNNVVPDVFAYEDRLKVLTVRAPSAIPGRLDRIREGPFWVGCRPSAAIQR
jgi:hypothetical protein